MKLKAFLDTNVLVDVLVQRPSTEASLVVFQAVYDGLIEAVITSQSIIDASYLAQKFGETTNILDTMQSWCDYINTDQINTFDLAWARKNFSGDFEDDAQVSRALDTYCDVFITSDKKLRNSYNEKYEHLRFMSPEEFVASVRQSHQ